MTRTVFQQLQAKAMTFEAKWCLCGYKSPTKRVAEQTEGPFSTHAGSYLKHNTPSGLFLRLYSQTVSLRWCLSCCPVSWPAFKHRPKYIFRDFRGDTLYEAHKIMLHKLQGYEIICEIKSRHHVQDMRPGVSEHLIASRSHWYSLFWTTRTMYTVSVTELCHRIPDKMPR